MLDGVGGVGVEGGAGRDTRFGISRGGSGAGRVEERVEAAGFDGSGAGSGVRETWPETVEMMA